MQDKPENRGKVGERGNVQGGQGGSQFGGQSGQGGQMGGQGQAGGMRNTLEKHLRGINWPVNKNDLITKVRSNGAPNDVIQQIQRLPQDRFQSETELTRAFER